MLKLINRNFSRTSNLLLRQQLNREPPAPILSEKLQNSNKNDDKGTIEITKLKRNEKELAQLITLLRNKKKKEHDNQIIVEGNQLIKEAVEAHIKLNKLIFSHMEKIKDVVEVLGKSTAGIEFIKIPMPDLTYYSVLQTCPGLIGIFDKPIMPEVKSNSLDVSVIADNVREPQNLGALIRISNALPVAKMLLPKGSVDPWDTKSIRGSCGSVFHLPVKSGLIWEEISTLNEPNTLVLIADNNISKYDKNVVINYDKITPELVKNRHVTVIIGGETHGVSEEALMYAKEQGDYRVVNIPVDQSVNSLNVATALGIILFELRRVLMT